MTREVNAMRISTLLLAGVASLALATVSRNVFPFNRPFFADLLWFSLCLGPFAAAAFILLERFRLRGKTFSPGSLTTEETEKAVYASVRKSIGENTDRKSVA